jgi:hypothetical protein
MTRYIVYRAHTGGEGLHSLSPVAEVEAQNADAAISKVISTDHHGADFVAIPERYVRIRRVAVESQPKVVLGALPAATQEPSE